MINIIAETAWHHEGDFLFMKNLVQKACRVKGITTIKLHITLDLDEYMDKRHSAYGLLKSWMLSESNWVEIINIIRESGKSLLLLLNDVKAVEFARQFEPEMVEIHSVCLNVPRMQRAVLRNFSSKTKIVVGVGGSTVEEIDQAVNFFGNRDLILMFGFQNYPTDFANINLQKIAKIQKLYPDVAFGYADHTAWDSSLNELVSLLVLSNNMNYLEKHVTTNPGEERCDYSSAISMKKLEDLVKGVEVIESIKGDGSLALNSSELRYAEFGPMKMAAVAKRKILKGEALCLEDLHFCRNNQTTSMSQVDILKSEGLEVLRDIDMGKVIDRDIFIEGLE